MAQAVLKNNLKGYSCMTCRNRKIKCDKCDPCANCIKAEVHCSYVAPTRGKRKRTKAPKESMHAKLKRYEQLLQSYGEHVEPSKPGDDSDSATASIVEAGTNLDQEAKAQFNSEEIKPKLISTQGSSAYFESTMWTNLGDGVQHPELGSPGDALHEAHTEDSELFLGLEVQSNTESLASLHPNFQICTTLKEVYIDRVDPLAKILHMPTFWDMLTNGIQRASNLLKSDEALIFAFYLSAISALDDLQCQRLFKANQSVVFARYQRATRQALVNAAFLSTSSPTTLQAYALFLLCMRNGYRADTLYVLTGTMVRLARKMGLHRDGTKLGLSPFETEMRRRLWWNIVHVDFRTADLMGMNPSLELSNGDVKMPLNLEDEDFSPDMAEFPPERKSITAISLCLIRCEIIWALRKFAAAYGAGDIHWEALLTQDMPVSKKQSIIAEIEDQLESKYLRYCDPCNPLHTFMSIMLRSSICKMRLAAHNPRQFASAPHAVSQQERDMVFENARKLLEYVNLVQSGHSGLSKYTWLLGTSYLWNTMLYVLLEAKRRKTGPEVDKLWGLIGQVFSYYPQMFERSAGPVYIAIGKWTLEVWDDYVNASTVKGLMHPVAPDYIDAIRQCRTQRPETRGKDNAPAFDAAAVVPTNAPDRNTQAKTIDNALPALEPLEAYDFPDLMSFEIDPDEWMQWEQLIAEQGGLEQVGNLK